MRGVFYIAVGDSGQARNSLESLWLPPLSGLGAVSRGSGLPPDACHTSLTGMTGSAAKWAILKKISALLMGSLLSLSYVVCWFILFFSILRIQTL